MSSSASKTRHRSDRSVNESTAGDATDHVNDGGSAGVRRSRRRQEFEALHQEMELVEHGVAKSGHARRIVPRVQSKVRTMKRKRLERQEAEAAAAELEDKANGDDFIRPRGALAAVEDSIIQGSLIFGGTTNQSLSRRQNADDDEADGVAMSDDEASRGEEALDERSEEDDQDGQELDDEDAENSDESEEDDTPAVDGDNEMSVSVRSSKRATKHVTKKAKSQRSGSAPPRKSRRPLQRRLRNFRSRKMAERHGAALGAHVSGKPGLAIRKLKQVAASAPAAPQVYSSLGMVYEDMLLESQRKHSHIALDKETEDVDEEAQDKTLVEQLSLAKKAYGSYHVAAIFCKRDYSLWLRAADSASEIACLHTTTMLLPGIANNVIEYHRGEKQRWLEEAKHDYQMADNLNPPGIDIPAKLASTLIELGHLSEALTLLSHLKNRDDFDCSFRAWILYADLMLRIGHECIQWNLGIQTNSNHMFRRWLRKFSTKFDWKERRLQALAKALEAACGSHNCRRFIDWLKQRAESYVIVDAAEDANEDAGLDESGRGASEPDFDGYALADPTDTSRTAEVEAKKQLLLQTNQAELAAYDKATEAMLLDLDSLEAQQRNLDRHKLVGRHKSEVTQLVGECHQESKASSRSTSGMKSAVDSNERSYPISASCRTVLSIASELLRHLLSMQLFIGGRLAGESVSLYLKERAALRDHRVHAREEFDQSQKQPINVFAVQHETYDESDHDSDDEDLRAAPLSDDEDLDNATDDKILQTLRSGVLPSELQFLYGLCLTGEGGKMFLAVACLQAVNDIPLDSVSWITERVIDTGVVSDESWLLFRLEKTQSLGRIAAMACAIDVFNCSACDQSVTSRVAPLLRANVAELTGINVLERLFSAKGQVDIVSSYRQNLVAKILAAEIRYNIDEAEVLERAGRHIDTESVLDHAVSSLSRVLPIVWKVDKGSISSTCCEIVDTTSRTINLICLRMDNKVDATSTRWAQNSITAVTSLISMLCDSPQLTIADDSPRSTSSLTTIPMSSSWLTPDLAALTLRSLNLCVAMNVSLFSGWEAEKFSLRLMRGSSFNFYGITTESGVVAGLLTASQEEEVVYQWELAKAMLPTLDFDFKEKLQRLKDTAWYESSHERQATAEARHRIAANHEDRGLCALLSFSRICLRLAKDGQASDKMLFLALSILLPVSQFCINETIWDSTIGRSEAEGTSKLWQDFSFAEKASVAPSYRPGYVRPCKRALATASESDSERALHEWFSWEDSSDPISNLVALPLQCLSQTWSRWNNLAEKDLIPSPPGSQLMKEVDQAVSKLRSSYTIPAVEKASLQVSASLIRLASHPECRNPIVCIQEAVMFASVSSKGGTCDQVFQARLPSPEACRPIDALLILGRAECLNALHFCQEAAFLCCYVAAACGLRRKEDPTFRTDVRWTIVASLAYDLSVAIRTLAEGLVRESDKREDTSGTWNATVMQELRHARLQGLQWRMQVATSSDPKKSNGKVVTANERDIVDHSRCTDKVNETTDEADAIPTAVEPLYTDESDSEEMIVTGFVAV